MNKNVSKKIDLFSTIEYNQFKSIKGNRAVSPPHVRSIIESITEHNYLFEFPISVTNDLEVIDGQHRLEAAKQLGKMIWYRKIDIKGDTAIRDIQLINTAVKGWITTDYLKSYIARGFSEYERLWDFAQRYKYSIATSASLLMGYSTTKKEVYQTFRSGRFKITHEDKATEYVEYVEKIMPFLQENLYQHREFIKAMKNALKFVDKERLLQKFKMKETKLTREIRSLDYLRKIEDIYNYMSQKKTRLY